MVLDDLYFHKILLHIYENWYLCIHILEIYLFIHLYIKNCCKEEVKGAKIGTFPEW